MGRNHRNRDRVYNALSRMTEGVSINPNEFKELWKVFKLSSNPEEGEFNGGITQGEYVSKIFGELNEGAQLVRNFLIPADEFVDPLTKQSGTIRLKNNGIGFISDPDVDSFFPKWLWKGFLETFSPQLVEKERAVYFLTQNDPITDETTGKITFTDVYMLYYAKNSRTQGNFKQSKITLSYIDSNVAKNGSDQYITMEFYLKPSQPQNVKYIRYTPKTNAFIRPRSFIVETDLNGSLIEQVLKIDKEKTGRNMLNWELVNGYFKTLSDSSFDMVDTLWAEHAFMYELNRALVSANEEDSIPGIIIIGDGYPSLGSADFINSGENYRNIGVGDILGFGAGNLETDFISFITDTYRVGGKNSNITQFPDDTTFSEDKEFSGANRIEANWKNNSSYFLHDIYHLEATGFGFLAQQDNISMSLPLTAFSDEQKIDLFIDLIEGNGQINGLSLSSELPALITEDWKSNVLEITEEGYGLVNAMGNIQSIFEPKSWVYNKRTFAKSTLGEGRINLPDPDQTFAQGLIMKRDLFRDTNYSDTKYKDSAIIFEVPGADSNVIGSLEVGAVQGTCLIEYLDKDMQPAIGINTDGSSIVLPPLTLSSPQRYGPLNGRVKIAYI